MAKEFKLSYTGQEINTKLGKIDTLVASVNGVKPDVNGNIDIDGLVPKVLFTTVPVNWTKSGNFYYQDIAVEGMSEKYSPIVNCQYGNDQDMNAKYKEAFGLVHDVDTMDGSVRIWCTSAPTIEFTVKFTIMGWYEIVEYPSGEGVSF